NLPGNYERFDVVGPISYTGDALVDRDIRTLRAALDGLRVADAFMTATTPMMGRAGDRNILDHYSSEQAYMYALADALHDEYKSITDAGFILQVELGAVNPRRQLRDPHASVEDIRKATDERVELLNHALRDVPEDQVRYHHCWG